MNLRIYWNKYTKIYLLVGNNTKDGKRKKRWLDVVNSNCDGGHEGE